MIQPVFDERLNMHRKFIPVTRTCPLRKLSEADQDGYPEGHVSTGVVLLGEPHYVALNRVADPGCADSIDRGRTDEIRV